MIRARCDDLNSDAGGGGGGGGGQHGADRAEVASSAHCKEPPGRGADNHPDADKQPPVQVRAHLVRRLGLVQLERLLRSGEKPFALPNVVR